MARGASGASTIAISRTNFTGAVTMSGDGTADGCDRGVQSVDRDHRQLGDGDVHGVEHGHAGRGHGHADGDVGHTVRTTTVALTVTGGGTGGTLTATPVVSTSSPWFNELQLRTANTGTLTALTVTIVVQRTPGVSYSGQYNTVGGQITQTNTSTTAAITYHVHAERGADACPPRRAGRSPCRSVAMAPRIRRRVIRTP